MTARTPEVGGFKSIIGRLFGIAGDPDAFARGTDSVALLLAGQVVASTRNHVIKALNGSNGVGAVVATGLKSGDVVGSVTNLTAPGDVSSSFEAVVSVDGQVQQTAATNLSAAVLLFNVLPRS